MGSNSHIEVYERLTAGLGDAIMLRPAIVANMAAKPDYKHALHVWSGTSHIFDDIEGLAIVLFDGEESERFARSRKQLEGKDHTLYELSASCLTKELAQQPNIKLSRQEMFCETVGVPFDVGNYRVNFFDDEKQFAKFFTCGMENPIGIHMRSSQRYRDYKAMESLVGCFAKSHDGIVVTIDREYRYNGKRSNVVSLAGFDYRQVWAVIAEMKLVVGPDSFGVHAAGSVGVPVYGIFGPTDPRCRLKYENVAWPGEYWRCGRQYCWYRPCKYWSCVNSRFPGYYWDDMVEKLGYALQGNGKEDIPRNDDRAVIRVRGLGDVLMTLPALSKIRSGMSMYGKIAYATGGDLAPLLGTNHLVDEVVSVDYPHSPEGLPAPPLGLDVSEFDRVDNLVNLVDYCPLSDRVERIRLFADALGVSDIDENFKFVVPNDWLRDARKLLGEYGVGAKDEVVALQVGSAGQSRYWPRRRWEKFVRLAIRRGRKVVLLSDAWRNCSEAQAVNLTGETDIKLFVGIIALCDVFVGPDSAGVHVAGCVGTEAVGLFGSVDPKLRISHYPTVVSVVGRARCAPCNDWGKVSCGESRRVVKCMWSISARRVMRKVEGVLRGAGSKSR